MYTIIFLLLIGVCQACYITHDTPDSTSAQPMNVSIQLSALACTYSQYDACVVGGEAVVTKQLYDGVSPFNDAEHYASKLSNLGCSKYLNLPSLNYNTLVCEASLNHLSRNQTLPNYCYNGDGASYGLYCNVSNVDKISSVLSSTYGCMQYELSINATQCIFTLCSASQSRNVYEYMSTNFTAIIPDQSSISDLCTISSCHGTSVATSLYVSMWLLWILISCV